MLLSFDDTTKNLGEGVRVTEYELHTLNVDMHCITGNRLRPVRQLRVEFGNAPSPPRLLDLFARRVRVLLCRLHCAYADAVHDCRVVWPQDKLAQKHTRTNATSILNTKML